MKILVVDDIEAEIESIVKTLNIIRDKLKSNLELVIDPKTFREANELAILDYDFIFLDIKNDNQGDFNGNGGELIKNWLHKSSISKCEAAKKICWLSHFNNIWQTDYINDEHLQDILMTVPKVSSAINFAEFILKNYRFEYIIDNSDREDIKNKLRMLISSEASLKILINTNCALELPIKQLVYVESKKKMLKNIINFEFAIQGTKKQHTTRECNEIDKKFKAICNELEESYYQEIYYQKRNDNLILVKREKPNYNNILNDILNNFFIKPALFYKFHKFILNLTFVRLNGFEIYGKNKVLVNFIQEYYKGSSIKINIEGVDDNLIKKLNLLVEKCKSVFE